MLTQMQTDGDADADADTVAWSGVAWNKIILEHADS